MESSHDSKAKSSGIALKVALGVGVLLLGAQFSLKDQGGLSAQVRQLVATFDGSGTSDSEESDFALFTHERGELHCMERELRHPCVSELRDYISDKSSTERRSTALTCVNDVLASTTDYWELRNMTHLLLDLDTNIHVFDIESRNDVFVIAGIKFAEKLMEHKQCMADFDKKNPMETRCVPLYGKIVMLKYKNAGMDDEAKKVFDRLTSLSWDGEVYKYGPGEAVQWDHWQHTPQIWLPNLRSQLIWPREQWKDLPVTTFLEENFETLRKETEQALIRPDEAGFEDAYRFLYSKGSWDTVMLYHNRTFSEECETVFPKMCALLKTQLPSKPGMPWTQNQNEQAMVIKMAVGTDVELHSGPANNILNIHIGISGLEGAALIVGNNTYEWEEGKVIAWDGSYDHSVNCLKCKKERVIMMVRYMHPDTTFEHFKGIKRTHYEEVPAELQ